MARAPKSSRSTIAALIVVALIVGAVVWIGQAFIAHNRLQNCIDAGRHDCLSAFGG